MGGETKLSLERAELFHLEEIKEIELDCGISSWSLQDYQLELDRRDSFFRVCKIKNKIAGFILARLIMIKTLDFELKGKELELDKSDISDKLGVNILKNEAEIYNIGVKKEYQKRGIGTFLLLELLEASRLNDIRKIWLEVRTSNSRAIRFYESQGFKIIGIRKNLYREPVEDGFIMCLNN